MSADDVAVEMIRAYINRRPGHLMGLWVRAFGRRRSVAMSLTWIAAELVRINAKARDRRPGELLNELRAELRRNGR